MKKCEQQVQDHKELLDRDAEFTLWLQGAQRKLDQFQEKDITDRSGLEEKQSIMKVFIQYLNR